MNMLEEFRHTISPGINDHFFSVVSLARWCCETSETARDVLIDLPRRLAFVVIYLFQNRLEVGVYYEWCLQRVLVILWTWEYSYPRSGTRLSRPHARNTRFHALSSCPRVRMNKDNNCKQNISIHHPADTTLQEDDLNSWSRRNGVFHQTWREADLTWYFLFRSLVLYSGNMMTLLSRLLSLDESRA